MTVSRGSSSRKVVTGGMVAATISGLPSTTWALINGADPLAATRAAGTLLPGRRQRPGLFAGVVAHATISAGWTVLFGLAARRWRLGAPVGALAGLGIAALDLGVLARRYPAIAALPQGPQVLDHIVFGAVLGRLLRAD